MTIESESYRRLEDSLDLHGDTQDAPHEHDAVLIVGAGQNTAHMGESLARLGEQHPVYVAEVSQPQIDVHPDRLFLVNTEEGQRALEQRVKLGVRAVYVSVVPALHEEIVKKYVEHAGNDEVGIVVTAKPAVKDRDELRRVEAVLKAAHAQRRERHGDGYDPKKNHILYVHEHYRTKGAWYAFIEKFGEIVHELGLPRSAVVDIEEARTAEDEGRTKAFEGGALEDLGPHVISLGLDVQVAINENTAGKFVVADRSDTNVRRFRYEDSELPAGVETSFIVDGKTQIREIMGEGDDIFHDLDFTWRGGKGLVDKKEAILTFVHPDTGVATTIIIDLKNNKILIPEDAPQSVKDLFPETQFFDNGYGISVEEGLNGGDPDKSFQSWSQARTVTIMGDNLGRKARERGDPIVHSRGVSLRQLEYAAA